MTIEISEMVLAESFFIIGLLAFIFIGFASLISKKQKEASAK
tara:strand:- start:141 stop:266 length:126 start_codon:yes stop_codon:yes gene_type:complete